MRRTTLIISLLGLFISGSVFAQSFEYLEEKTAFCYSEQSLAKYLQMAKVRNIDGLNQLVIQGECNFVPDGEVMSLRDYKVHRIGTMPIVAFEKDSQELWTFHRFVQKSEIGSL